MKVLRAQIVVEAGKPTEAVSLLTDLPSVHGMVSEDDRDMPQWVKFEAPKGTGKAYLLKHFPGMLIEEIKL